MKQIITVVMTVFIYIGTIGLIDTSIAAGHHGHEKKGNPKMLFRDIDMDKQQRDQVKRIMGEQKEKSEAMLESIKQDNEPQMLAIQTETRDRLSSVLTAEQMSQFDKNAKRAKNKRSKMKKKNHKKGKKHMKHNNKDHK